jgi:transcriptional regulator with GAF, ATPase, and Fis domain
MATSIELQTRTLKGRVEAYERRLIMVALERAGGNQHRAALALGVRPTTLNEKLKRLGIGVVRHVVDLERPDPEERRRVMAALAESNGRVGHAAARLGLTRAKLRDELRRLGIGLERAIENEPRWPA